MKRYDDTGSYRGWDHTRPWYKFALKLLPKADNEKVLDLGAGNGEFSVILKKFNKKVYCIDYCQKYFKKLKRKGFKSYLSDFNNSLPFRDEFFDGVCCLEVIEHVVKAEQLLLEINRILKKNGWLIVSTLNISWFGYRLLALSGKVPFKEGYHFRFFNYFSLINKLDKAGFKIIKKANFTPLPFINRIHQVWIETKIFHQLFAQDLVFLCFKK